ncbi:MAG: 3-deoxy-D-manno-octulosonate 8-phosphate phosphatase (KDO 8-P phosphatase) [Polaromonas sp.]|jgi:3-deoxy-D-manno-octulosonate 8-phosphate phosphatase (KDO 8-P phosphatase)
MILCRRRFWNGCLPEGQIVAELKLVTQALDLARIKLLCCDVDGVLTDGGLYYGNDGSRFARFHVLDGMGLKRVQASGVKLAFITQSKTRYIELRARDLGIDYCFLGVDEKLSTMNGILESLPFGLEGVAHIADDVNDLSLLRAVGTPITVPGGVPEVHAACRYVTQAPGGNGAVRELCDAILAANAA